MSMVRCEDDMGICGRMGRRIACRRISLWHLRAIVGVLTVTFCFMTFNYVTITRVGRDVDSRTGKAIEEIGDSVRIKPNIKREPAKGTFLGPQSNAVSRNITKTLFIHSTLQSIVTWRELEDLVTCVRVEEGKLRTKPCMVQCPTGERIEITLDSDLAKARSKDVLLFGLSPFTLTWSFNKALGYKPPEDQLVVFYSMENVLRMHKWNKRLGMLKYHVDLSYGTFSDVTIPYAQFEHSSSNTTHVGERNWMEGKTKLIAWMASNCKEVFWPRNEYISELQRHMKVDTYGRCGNLTCLPRMSEECIKMVSKYKFYLSLENSECDEYLTEKIWETGLANDVIPVVYGPRKSDYAKYAPPNSFIHISDFDTPADLARYIKRVANDKKLYNSYFKWREQGRVVKIYPNLQPDYFCKLLPHMDAVPTTMREVKDSGFFKSCRHQLSVYKNQNLTEIQSLQGWKPW